MPLGRADSFAVLAGSTVTNTGPSVISGDVGVSPGNAVTGFPLGMVLAPGKIHAADSRASQAQTDLAIAYDNAARRTATAAISGDLAGRTLTPGVYRSASSISLNGGLTLDARGDPNAVFVLQAGSTLLVGSSASIRLIGGARACQVFWQVGSSATIGVRSAFAGNILARSSISLKTNATVDGRALAGNGAVTLDTNVIAKPACATITASPGSGTTAGRRTSPRRSGRTTSRGRKARPRSRVVPPRLTFFGAPAARAAGATPRRRSARSSRASTRARTPSSRRRIRPAKPIKGRIVNTDSYKKNQRYCKLYKCKQPLKMRWKLPKIRGASGKLRISLFIKGDSACPIPEVCLKGDDRGFDKRFDSARTRVTFVLDFKRRTLTLLDNPSCSKGKLIADGCSSPRRPKRLKVTTAGPNEPLKIDYAFQNSRLPKKVNPSIDGVLKIFRDANGHLALKINNDNYPSIEAYYDPRGRKPPRAICRNSQHSPTDLITTGSLPKRCYGRIS